MKHAGADALESLEPFLAQVRAVPMLSERTRGVFYRRSKAFLHFHEDPAGLFADVRLRIDEDFVRVPVNSDAERARLLGDIQRLGDT